MIESPIPTEKQIFDAVQNDFSFQRFKYRKLEDGRYDVFCPACHYRDTIAKKDFKRIQMTRVCPRCFRSSKTSRKEVKKRCLSQIGGSQDGFIIYYSWTFEHGFDIEQFHHVFHQYDNTKVAIRGLKANMGFSISVDPDEFGGLWRTSRSYVYGYNFNRCDEFEPWERIGRKAFYFSVLEGVEQLVKPNQVKLLKDNLYNAEMVRTMVVFNLDYDEQIVNAGYEISNVTFDAWKRIGSPQFNKYTLAYLKEHNLPFMAWIDHVKMLKELNFPIEKPKNFEARHHEISNLITDKRDEEAAAKIVERYPIEQRREVELKHFTIRAFKTAKEIRDCGKTLHNCIGSYINKYARKETDLFYLEKDGSIVGAVEVKGKSLVQAYGSCNKELPKEDYKEIALWASGKEFNEKNNQRAS